MKDSNGNQGVPNRRNSHSKAPGNESFQRNMSSHMYQAVTDVIIAMGGGLVMAGVDGQSWKAKESDLGR